MSQYDANVKKFMQGYQLYSESKVGTIESERMGLDKLANFMREYESARKLYLRPLAREIAQERERREMEACK